MHPAEFLGHSHGDFQGAFFLCVGIDLASDGAAEMAILTSFGLEGDDVDDTQEYGEQSDCSRNLGPRTPLSGEMIEIRVSLCFEDEEWMYNQRW